METPESHSTPDLFDYLGVLWRRKWIILPFAIVTPLVVYVLSSSKTPIYEASADVLLNRQAQGISGIEDPTLTEPVRMIKTQAQLARLPVVAFRVVDAAGLDDRNGYAFLAQSGVDAEGTTDLFRFRVRDPDPEIAETLATEYARQYIRYRAELDTDALRNTVAALTARIRRLRSAGAGTALYASLVEKRQELETALSLQTSNASLVRPADGAGQIAPRPMRSATLALMLGLVIGLGLAFLLDMLDVRVRTADEIAEQLELPLIGRLPEASRTIRARGGLAMLNAQDGPEAEAIRILRTNLDFVNLDRERRSIMITSATAGEGKSTTISNLALALARTGRHVLLVDLDLRRPTIARYFGLDARPGITDLAAGAAGLDEVCREWRPDQRSDRQRLASSSISELSSEHVGDNAGAGTLTIVTAGTIPPDPGEFVAGRTLADTLRSLPDLADIILVDSPPMLLTGDALSLSSHVDGLLFVTHIEAYRRKYAHEIRRLLASSPASKLGLVVIDNTVLSTSAYGYREQREWDAEPTVI
ncbi:MAG: P-loop NTPase [Gaiellaceae bacterium]